jgi:hypothetical protein
MFDYNKNYLGILRFLTCSVKLKTFDSSEILNNLILKAPLTTSNLPKCYVILIVIIKFVIILVLFSSVPFSVDFLNQIQYYQSFLGSSLIHSYFHIPFYNSLNHILFRANR